MAKTKVKFVKATQEHIDAMKGHLRESDKKSCWALVHFTAEKSLQRAFDRATLCWVALVDGFPAACWGVNGEAVIYTRGLVWIFTTDAIRKMGFRAARHSKKFIKIMLDKFGLLETQVDVRNKVSLAWLTWCGFNVEKAEPFGLDNRLFHRLWMETGGI